MVRVVARSLLHLCEHITRATHRDNAARMFRIVFDRGAHARDVHIDRAIERVERLALEQIHQLLAREHAAGALRQRDEQIELIRRHVTHRCVDARNARIAIDFEPAEAQCLATKPCWPR